MISNFNFSVYKSSVNEDIEDITHSLTLVERDRNPPVLFEVPRTAQGTFAMRSVISGLSTQRKNDRW